MASQTHGVSLSPADKPLGRGAADTISAASLKEALAEALQGKDLEAISVGEVRRMIAVQINLSPDGLEGRKKEIKKLTEAVEKDMQSYPCHTLFSLSPESVDGRNPAPLEHMANASDMTSHPLHP